MYLVEKKKLRKIIMVTAVTAVVFFSVKSFSVEFNTDLLELSDKNNIDFSRFSNPDYIMPGVYELSVAVNNQLIFDSLPVDIIQTNDHELPQACLTKNMIKRLGFKEDVKEQLFWSADGKCALLTRLPGVEVIPVVNKKVIKINIPQVWLEYSDAFWLPPSRWENGISGVLADYNMYTSLTEQSNGGGSKRFGYNGTLGANFNSWRLRADYRGNYNHTVASDNTEFTQRDFDWTRIYAYRPIPSWRSTLEAGENYVYSDIFDSWRYIGFSLESDERMIPPTLRGYAPRVTGIAETNARVIITQQGRVIYDSTVPAGPFTIDSIDGSIRGQLDVEVLEQDGKRKTFRVDAASVPYLTRPGQVRYKLNAGQTSLYGQNSKGPLFLSGEASWGINNSWSLYGGGVTAGKFNSIAIGVARDLELFGSLSADVSQSVATLRDEDTRKGTSWRLSYSKRFDEANTDITFAGYRFSERDYMTMSQYINTRYNGDFSGQSKELYSISLSKHVEDADLSLGLQYSHQSYWDRQAEDFYNLSLNHYFDGFGLSNISVGVSASRTHSQNRELDSFHLNFSVPIGTGYLSYGNSFSHRVYDQTLGYGDSISEGLGSYNLSVGLRNGNNINSRKKFSGYYSRHLPVTSLSANLSWEEQQYTSLGMTLSGGLTATEKGLALHSGNSGGGTRLMIDTDGVEGVRLDDGRAETHRFGIAVLNNINDYHRNIIRVDVNNLPSDVEVKNPVSEVVLTEGSIGYRRFETLKGSKLFTVLRLENGYSVPFGAVVMNSRGQELGIVGEDGLSWLTGVNSQERINVHWEKKQCSINLPELLETSTILSLTCSSKFNL